MVSKVVCSATVHSLRWLISRLLCFRRPTHEKWRNSSRLSMSLPYGGGLAFCGIVGCASHFLFSLDFLPRKKNEETKDEEMVTEWKAKCRWRKKGSEREGDSRETSQMTVSFSWASPNPQSALPVERAISSFPFCLSCSLSLVLLIPIDCRLFSPFSINGPMMGWDNNIIWVY